MFQAPQASLSSIAYEQLHPPRNTISVTTLTPLSVTNLFQQVHQQNQQVACHMSSFSGSLSPAFLASAVTIPLIMSHIPASKLNTSSSSKKLQEKSPEAPNLPTTVCSQYARSWHGANVYINILFITRPSCISEKIKKKKRREKVTRRRMYTRVGERMET